MNLIPKGATRFAGRQLLKLNANSPTILVVAGVIGFGATVVVAAKATRNIDPILDEHKQARAEIGYIGESKEQAREVGRLYGKTGIQMTRLYAPTIALGVLSVGSVLYGHKIIRGRHIATMAAYSGLMEQFKAYRGRVVQTLGEDVERGIYNGAHGEWKEQPGKKGEYKLEPVWNDNQADYLHPLFAEDYNVHWTPHAESNYLFLKGSQQHLNNLLQIRGHVFLNDVYDSLKIPRTREGSVLGWLFEDSDGDGYIDYGFMASADPQAAAFRNFESPDVRLNFNVDGVIWDKI